ncbi:MAG: cupin domain-containing protein [Alteromonas oceani]
MLAGWLAGVVSLLSGCAMAETHTIPTERVGTSPKGLETVDLGSGFDSSQWRNLRMREATLQPGGSLPMHSHANRPAVAYMLQGELTVYIEGKPEPIVYRAGEYYQIYKASHAMRNVGDVPVVFIEVDLTN